MSKTQKAETFVSALTLAQTRSGKGFDVDAVMSDLASRKAGTDRQTGLLLFHVARAFHAIVTVSKAQNGRQFVQAIGYSDSYASMLRRLGGAAARFGIGPVGKGSDVWAYLVQRKDQEQVGKALDIEDDGKALDRLRALAADRKSGKADASTRNSARLDGKGKGKGDSDETPDTSRPATVDDLLKSLEAWTRKASDADYLAVRTRVQGILTHRDGKVTSKAHAAYKARVTEETARTNGETVAAAS